MIERVQAAIYAVLERGSGDTLGRWVSWILVGLILLNVTAVCLETVPALDEHSGPLFRAIEHVSIAIFTIAYLLRLWGATRAPGREHPLWGRLRFAVSPLAIIDLLRSCPSSSPCSTGTTSSPCARSA